MFLQPQKPLHRQHDRQLQALGFTDSPRSQHSLRHQQHTLGRAVASSTPERRRVSQHARPLGQVLEEAVQAPTSIDVEEVAEAVTVSVKKTSKNIINSPTTACIALNLGAALFGSNQVSRSWLLSPADQDMPTGSTR